MYIARKEDSSIYRYFRDVVLSDFIEFQEKDELVLSNFSTSSQYKIYDIVTDLYPSPLENGRGLTYFDDLSSSTLVDLTTTSGTPEQSSRITVYDRYMNILDESSYMVDYVSCKVIMLDTSVPKYIDYHWYYVGMVDGWDSLAVSSPPIVVMDIEKTKKTGYQLGGGKKVIRKCNLFIFSSSSSERLDLTEVLYDGLYLKTCPIYDFSSGLVLDFDGTFRNRRNNLDKSTNLFNRTVVSGTSNMSFEDVEAKNINLPLTLSRRNESTTLTNLNAYRSKISFNLVYYN